ncbi:MAG: histidine kinase [Lachnospiraceae bacterium]|nr:histidine kinase [Lachnospiraceae bacterium]MBP5746443.1 histidine kinase [Lachnospiraceae bacterium]
MALDISNSARVFEYTLAALELALILQLVQMPFAVWADSYISKREKRILLIVSLIVLTLIIQGHLDFIISTHAIKTFEYNAILATAVSVYGYIFRPVVLVLFIMMTNPSARARAAWVLVAINAVVYMTAFFSSVSISFDDNGHFHRGPLGYTCFAVSFLLLAYLVYVSVVAFKGNKRSDMIIPIFVAVVIVAACGIDLFCPVSIPVSFLMCAITNGSVFYYLWIHLRFIREHERSMLAESRIQIMMSQIQPHFLYNTLASIQALCATDPPKAAKTVEMFADYLRQNLESLGDSDLIPLNKELEHCRIYTQIELLMFPEIDIEYKIGDSSFMLPALTIQPLVENAIRHGVRGIKDPKVTVLTYKDEEYHNIIIEDNGRGFDAADPANTGGKHIGIRNVRERLEKMCSGSLEVVSNIGKGCRITIRIPVKKEV